MLDIDLNGRGIAVNESDARWLKNQAQANGGCSTPMRDLALLLDRALLSGRPLLLRRADLHPLRALLALPARPDGLADLAELLGDAGPAT